MSGYELYRELRCGGETTYQHDGKEYVLSFFGERTCCGNGLVVLEKESGETRRFRSGYSSEACHNFVSTLEKRRWDDPVGAWLNPERWDEPPLTDWEKRSGYGALNDQKWLCEDGFVSHAGATTNHNKAKGLERDSKVKLTAEEWEELEKLTVKERVPTLLKLRGVGRFAELH